MRKRRSKYVDDAAAHSGDDTSEGSSDEERNQQYDLADPFIDNDLSQKRSKATDDDEEEVVEAQPASFDADIDGVLSQHENVGGVQAEMDVDADPAPPLDPLKWVDFREERNQGLYGLKYSLHTWGVKLAQIALLVNDLEPFHALENAIKELNEFVDFFEINRPSPADRNALMGVVTKVFPSKGVGASLASINSISYHYRLRLAGIMALFQQLKPSCETYAVWSQEQVILKLNKLSQALTSYSSVAEQLEVMRQTLTAAWTPELSPVAPLVWFDRTQLGEYCTPFQRVLLYLYEYFHSRAYRVDREYVYSPKLVNGQFVHIYYKNGEDDKIDNVIGRLLLVSEANEKWLDSTHQNKIAPDVISHFKNYGQLFLPPMKVCRYLFSYRNGVFDCRSLRWYKHKDLAVDALCAQFFDVDVPEHIIRLLVTKEDEDDFRATNERERTPGKRRFNVNFWATNVDPRRVSDPVEKKRLEDLRDESRDWFYAIKTPQWDQVFEYQWQEPNTPHVPSQCWVKDRNTLLRFNFSIWARLFHNVKEMDKDQRVIAVTGQSGTGKSMAERFVNAVYPSQHIHPISPSDDSNFNLQGLEDPDCFIWLINELQRDCKLKASDFFAMIAGDNVSVRRKNLVNLSRTISACGVTFGNSMEIFPFGSRRALARRVYLILFRRMIAEKDKDDDIEQGILNEVPFLVIKMSIAYYALRKYMQDMKFKNIMRVWPEYFAKNQEQMVCATDTMESFVQSKYVYLKDDAKCSLNDFRKAFKDYLALEMGVDAKKLPYWKPTLYESAFNQHAISLRTERVDGHDVDYVFGISLRSEDLSRLRGNAPSSVVAGPAFVQPAEMSPLVINDRPLASFQPPPSSPQPARNRFADDEIF